MRKKKINALLALLLVFSMAFSQPAAVFAEENTSVSDSEVNDGAIAEAEENSEGGALSGDDTQVPEEGDASTGSEDSGDVQTPGDEGGDNAQNPDGEDGSQAGDENGDDAQNPDGEDGSQTGDENGDDAQEPDEEDGSQAEDGSDVPEADEIDDETIKAQAQSNGISVENQKRLNELGFKTMSLSSSMMLEKEALAKVVEEMPKMEAGKDYHENELVYMADSEKDAKEVAECYGGTLSEYSYGVAVADIEQSVQDAVEIAADVTIPIPAVYPNIVYTIAGEWDNSSVDNSEVTIEDVSDEEQDSVQPEVSDAAENTVMAASVTDPGYDEQWHHETINTTAAWGVNPTPESKGKGVTVAVLDSGIDYNHEDLKENIVDHISMIGAYDQSGKGMDMDGHGTHCAGLIAAADNGVGGVGVAPRAGIYSVQVTYEGSGSTAWIVAGLNAAITQNVDVISMSLCSKYYDELEKKAIDNALKKGIVVVASAGNGEAVDKVYEDDGELYYDNMGVSQKQYPAGYNNVISVAATGKDNYLTRFSNYGSWVDIAAPGADIYSTLPDSKYGNMSGTSMACPIVSGTVALMLAANKNLRDTNTIACVNRIRKELVAGARADGARGYWYYYKNMYYNEDDKPSYPLLDVEGAVAAVDDAAMTVPVITFTPKTPDNKNVLEAGAGTQFTLKTDSVHDKIYYTINGKKPTAATGTLYTGAVSLSDYSGKTKIQAIAVRGSKTSKVFSKTYTLNVKINKLIPAGVEEYEDGTTPKAEMKVSIGKSIQLAVDTQPIYANNKKVTWSCTDAKNWIKVSKSGKVTCNKNATAGHSVTVTAKAQDGSNKECQFIITVVTDAASSLTLEKTSLTMSYWADYEGTETSFGGDTKYVSQYRLQPKGAANNQYLYKSSNTKVASVTADGLVIAGAKGKAKITVTANDGSGKKVVCNVNVVTPVIDIMYSSSNGYSGGTGDSNSGAIPIAVGTSLKLKTWVNGAYYNKYLTSEDKRLLAPSNKTLEWSSSSNKLTAKNGTIKCAKDAPLDTTVNVTISAKNGFGYEETVTVKFYIVDKVTDLYLDVSGRKYVGVTTTLSASGYYVYDPMYGMPTNGGAVGYLKVKTASGRTMNLKDYIEKYDDYDLLQVNVSNKDVVQYTFNPSIGACTLLGLKKGSAKVNYVLKDGSKKKFAVNIKVLK